MTEINLYAVWIGMLLGAIFGAIQGLFFHKEDDAVRFRTSVLLFDSLMIL